jgi:dihydrofolate reductase
LILAIIAAIARNRGIGKDGGLPWHIPEDLRRFKKLTMGHAVLMGKRTWHSIGRPLPGRRNVVLSRTSVDGVETYGSIDAALAALRGEERIFVIGGGKVYAQLIGRAEELYLTIVDREVEADTYFPPYEHLLGSTFSLVSSDVHQGFRFDFYRRQNPSGDAAKMELPGP